MNKKKSLEIIERLSNANGAPGFEDEVVEAIKAFGSEYGEITEDCLRNLYISTGENSGRGPIVQLDAHSDEVAFIVQYIMPNGTIKFTNLGNWVPYNIPAHLVRVRNGKGEYIPGIVASKPPHFMTDTDKRNEVELSSMVIDIGASSYEEAVRDYHIRIGEPIVPEASFNYNEQKDIMMGKAFDCRLGCAAMIDTLGKLKGKELKVNVVATFSSQEEVGSRGAALAVNRIKPDIAIVFEGCPADDSFSESYAIQTALKKGPMLRHMDSKMITSPRFQRFALNLAEKCGIPVQEAVRTGGATNGDVIHISNNGVPVIVIGVPVRYAHTHYGIASYTDYENAVKLACEVIASLDEEIIKGF